MRSRRIELLRGFRPTGSQPADRPLIVGRHEMRNGSSPCQGGGTRTHGLMLPTHARCLSATPCRAWLGREESNLHRWGQSPESCQLDDAPSERVEGVEPSSLVWKTDALPLSYTRITSGAAHPPRADGSPGCHFLSFDVTEHVRRLPRAPAGREGIEPSPAGFGDPPAPSARPIGSGARKSERPGTPSGHPASWVSIRLFGSATHEVGWAANAAAPVQFRCDLSRGHGRRRPLARRRARPSVGLGHRRDCQHLGSSVHGPRCSNFHCGGVGTAVIGQSQGGVGSSSLGERPANSHTVLLAI